jgi:hypothetical protein
VSRPLGFTKGAIALQAALYGPRNRDEVMVVKEFEQALRAAYANADRWVIFLPTPASVEAMRASVAGMASLLTELAVMQQGGAKHE